MWPRLHEAGDEGETGQGAYNAYDTEAIKVTMKGVGHVGYIANSIYTVKGESWSAGRLYDYIEKKAKGTVQIVLPDGVICKLDQKK